MIDEITYQGSKSRLLKVLKPLIEDNIEDGMRYVEPFGGGMNVFTAIDAQSKSANDINKYNISLWNDVKKYGIDALEDKWRVYLETLANCEDRRDSGVNYRNAKALYMDMKRDCLNDGGRYPASLLGFVAYACSFGGAWWNGFIGFNPKRGENYVKEALVSFKKQVQSAKNIENSDFSEGSYDSMDIEGNAFVYCDPPYGNTRGYDKIFNGEGFWNWCRNLVSLPNVKVLISEYSAPSDFICIWSANIQDKMGNNENVKTEKLFIHKSQLSKFNLSSLGDTIQITSDNIREMVEKAIRQILK